MDPKLENRIVLIYVLVGVLIIVGTTLFMFNQHKKDKQWEAKRAEVLAEHERITKVHDEIRDEKYEKYGTSKTREDYPAKYIVPNSEDKSEVGNNLPDTTYTDPNARPNKVNNDLKPAITSLSEADIKRLQSYPVAGEKGKGFFVSFEDFYTNERSEVDAILRDFTPVTLSTFKDARVEWLTDPKLVYFSWTAQYCVRGIISVTYYEEPNPFGLTQNVTYQREVEYRISNAVHNGQIKQTLEQTKYLSDWQAVSL